MESLRRQISSLIEQNQNLQEQLDIWEESHMQLNVSTGTDIICFATGMTNNNNPAVEDYPAIIMSSAAAGSLFYVDSYESSRWTGWFAYKLDGNMAFAAHATGTANYNTVSSTEHVAPNFHDTTITRLGATCHEILFEFDHSYEYQGHTVYVIPHVLFQPSVFKDIHFASDVGWIWTLNAQ